MSIPLWAVMLKHTPAKFAAYAIDKGNANDRGYANDRGNTAGALF